MLATDKKRYSLIIARELLERFAYGAKGFHISHIETPRVDSTMREISKRILRDFPQAHEVHDHIHLESLSDDNDMKEILRGVSLN